MSKYCFMTNIWDIIGNKLKIKYDIYVITWRIWLRLNLIYIRTLNL